MTATKQGPVVWDAREEACRCLMEITEEKGYSSVVLNRRIRQYPPSVSSRDKALVTHIVYTALTRLISIDYRIDAYSRTPVVKMKPYIRAVLRVALTQIFYMDRIPDRAAVNAAVDTVKRSPYRNLAGFVNAVLRGIVREKEKELLPEEPLRRMSVRYGTPEYMLDMWIQDYGEETAERIARVSAGKKALPVRANTLKIRPEELYAALVERLGEDSVHRSTVSPNLFYLDSADSLADWDLMRDGKMTVQDESSMLGAMALAVSPGMRVLDLCSAPGGKAAVLAEQMDNQGGILCCDIHPHKLKLIQEMAERLGLSALKTCLRDATVPVPEEEGAYDAVLLDAPCSGLGILRSKPDIRLNRREEDIAELCALQKKMLENAARFVKPGGRLVYSTCTLSSEENERNAEWFLRENPNFIAQNPEKDLPSLALCDTIKSGQDSGWRTILPQEGGRDGFFIAAFRKMQ